MRVARASAGAIVFSVHAGVGRAPQYRRRSPDTPIRPPTGSGRAVDLGPDSIWIRAPVERSGVHSWLFRHRARLRALYGVPPRTSVYPRARLGPLALRRAGSLVRNLGGVTLYPWRR